MAVLIEAISIVIRADALITSFAKIGSDRGKRKAPPEARLSPLSRTRRGECGHLSDRRRGFDLGP